MSLDVYLYVEGETLDCREHSGIFVRENGQTKEITRAEWDERYPGREPAVFAAPSESHCVFSMNITHNLNKMADAAGIYEALWRPEEIRASRAKQLIPLLRDGLARLNSDPGEFKKLNPSNGWGNYETLLTFVCQYLAACCEYPDAKVEVFR